MQQAQAQKLHGSRLSTSSHSSLSVSTNALLNGLLPSHRFSQASTSVPVLASNLTPNQLRALQKDSNRLKRSERIKHAILIMGLTIILALLLLITIESTTKLVEYQKEEPKLFSNLTKINNETNSKKENKNPIRAFFACVWIFNGLLLINCLVIHSIVIQRRSRRGRTIGVFLRDFIRIFDNGKSSSNNTFIDYLLKTCLLCFLWYLSCYLMFRSMTILISIEIIVLYSITAASKQLLGWIFLHEEFNGNKIIAYILASSALLFLAHDDGFHFNRFLFGLSMVTCAAVLKTSFDILVNGFVKDFTSAKLRIVMINVCLCGTCLLWPFVLLFHATQIEPFECKHIRWLLTIAALICALIFNVLTIVIPFKYTSLASVACLLFVIPSTSLIDRYLLNINYSPLVISAILCSFAGVLLSIIPKQWFQAGEAAKMKQAFGLLNKDPNTNPGTNTAGTSGTTTTATGTSSAFEEIRAQRRIRNALLYNEVKT